MTSQQWCRVTRAVTFVDARTLEVAETGAARFQAQNVEREVLERLRRECRGAPRRVERVSLTR